MEFFHPKFEPNHLNQKKSATLPLTLNEIIIT